MMKRDVIITSQVAARLEVFGRTDAEIREVAETIFRGVMAKADIPTEVYSSSILITEEQLALFEVDGMK